MLTVEIKREVPYRSIQWKTIGNIFHKYRSSAYTEWHTNGQKYIDQYLVNGKRHRKPLEGPAVTAWYATGQKDYEVYRVNGKRHRSPLKGPAVTVWYDDGQKWYEGYYIDGKLVCHNKYHTGR